MKIKMIRLARGANMAGCAAMDSRLGLADIASEECDADICIAFNASPPNPQQV